MEGMIESKKFRLTHLVAILLIPVSFGWLWFHDAATQDGPSHLAAAKIADEWIRQGPNGEHSGSVRSIYRLHFEPVPNWGGQALGMALIAVLPMPWAEVAMNLAGIWLPAISLAWLFESLRHPLRYGWQNERMPGSEMAFLALWITTMATNVLWTFGFSSFLLGTGLAWAFLRTLRTYGETGGSRLWLMLAALWCVTFLCHLVAFAIAGIISASLVIFNPKWSISRRIAITLALATALPLLIRYRMLTGDSPLEPIWEHFRGSEVFSLSNWARQFGWVDPVSLHSKTWHPLAGGSGLLALAFQPGLWVALTLVAVVAASVRAIISEFQTAERFDESQECIPARDAGDRIFGRDEMLENQRYEAGLAFRLRHWRFPRCVAWSSAVVVLAILGLLGPDSLGARQGHFLPQRFCLAALCIVPAVLVSTRNPIPVKALGFITIAWFLQTVSAIDFARRSHEMMQPVREDRAAIRPGDRILALVDAEPWPFRANPRLHADALLVTAAKDTVSWNLYESAHPYFPLRFRQLEPGRDPATLEAFSLATTGEDPVRTDTRVREILAASEGMVDVVYVGMDDKSDRRETVKRAIEARPGWSIQRSGPMSILFRKTPQSSPR